MGLTDGFGIVNLLARWLHVLSAIVWVGHLLFFVLVFHPGEGTRTDAERGALQRWIVWRALWWFRWASMVTLAAGLWLFVQNYYYVPGEGFAASPLLLGPEGVTDRGWWILLGMFLGISMWYKVWFIIWNNQRKILTGTADPKRLERMKRKVKVARTTNLYLLGPTLFAMLAPAHFGAFDWWTFAAVAAVSSAVVGWGAWQAGRVETGPGGPNRPPGRDH